MKTKHLFATAILAIASTNVQAASVIIPNGSFETPDVTTTSPYYAQLPVDNGTTVGAWQRYGGFAAVVKSGGPNGYNVSPTGILGSQFGDQSAAAGTGVFQDLTTYDGLGDPNQYWQEGTYTLTIGFFSRGDNPVVGGNTLDMRLYNRTARNSGLTVLGTTTILVSGVTTSQLTDYSLSVAIPSGSAAIGKPVGIWLPSTGASGSGDWGYDNVRLDFAAAAVPEPSSAVLGFAGLVLIFRRRR